MTNEILEKITDARLKIESDNRHKFTSTDLAHALALADRISEWCEEERCEDEDYEKFVTHEDLYWYMVDHIKDEDISDEALQGYVDDNARRFQIYHHSTIARLITRETLLEEYGWAIREWMVGNYEYLPADLDSFGLYENATLELVQCILDNM